MYTKRFFTLSENNDLQSFEGSTAKNLFFSVYVISIASFDNLFLFSVIIRKHYFP